MNVNIQTTKVFRFLENSNKRITIMQGGARSGKTFNILIWFLKRLQLEKNTTLSICRDPFAAMPRSIMKDFFTILATNNLYDKKKHNKTMSSYNWIENNIEFFGLDDQHKVQGPQREFLFINEADNTTWYIVNQLLMRTEIKIVIDFNPNINEDHWIYTKLKIRDDCDFFITTFLDNPFCPESQKKEIEQLKYTDKNLWRIYGEGLIGMAENLIYTNWEIIEKFPENCDEIFYGVDFGYNNPSTIIKVGIKDKLVYIHQDLYKEKLTNEDLIKEIEIIIPFELRNATIYADSAEPARIEEIKRSGYNIHPVKKGKNSIKDGIDVVKRHRLHITKESVNIIKEIKSYVWKEDKNGKIIDGEPVKFLDHSMDAIRYVLSSIFTKEKVVVFTSDLNYNPI